MAHDWQKPRQAASGRGSADWLAAAEISSGPVFRAVALGGKVSDIALADDSASRVVKRYARLVGTHRGTRKAGAAAAGRGAKAPQTELSDRTEKRAAADCPGDTP